MYIDFGPQFFSEGTTPIFYGRLLGRFTAYTVRQRLVEFRLLTSVREAWQ